MALNTTISPLLALIKAVQFKSEAEIERLLGSGEVDVNDIYNNDLSGDSTTALIEATEGGSTRIMEILLDAKADPNIRAISDSAVFHAIYKDKKEHVELLLDHDLNLEIITTARYTPLLYAASLGRTEIFRFLLERGASLEAETFNGKDVRAVAVEAGAEEIVALIDETVKQRRLEQARKSDDAMHAALRRKGRHLKDLI